MIHPLILWSCLGLFGLALLVTLLGLWRLRRISRQLAASEAWMPTLATVVATRVERRGASESVNYLPVVTYDYRAAGQTFRSETMNIGPPRGYDFERSARRVADGFAVGARVTAWIDPADPARSALVRRAPFKTTLVVVLIVLWVVTLGGIAVLLFAPGVVQPGPALRL